ncbi:Alpha/beta hydrolase [Glycomyces sambucus]|uniref:Alpha/beta hydrolase n=1 Tax=Glycomyces sambucus TaxID=380244 RepID=A0A1G9JNV9_9ACTN|nr:alpha/beta hydrolase [Glycomyces sambucus]SDL38992.1 Alpha/beta hydrolase [Glycomyces sambucus]
MGITHGGLLGADFGRLEIVAETWKSMADTLESEAGAVEQCKRGDGASLGADNWDGDAAEAGRARVRDLTVALDDRAAEARRVWAAITEAAEEFGLCQRELQALVEEAPSRGVQVAEDGSVTTPHTASTRQQQQVVIVRGEIDAVLERATAADEALKAAIGIWAGTFSESERLDLIHGAGDEAQELHELIDSGASPDAVNDWWSGLSEAERLGVLEGSPGLIAGLDGIPTDTRDAANRDLLDSELDRFAPTLDGDIASLEDRIAELEADWDEIVASDDRERAMELEDLQAELEGLETQRDQRDSLANLQEAIAGRAPSGQEYLLLGYDSAEDGKAIVAVGNPDTADNTAVYVPGTGADLDGASGTLLDRVDAMATDASQPAGSGETAVVLWLGYDAPNNPITDSPSISYAEDASAPLASFMSGLEATNHDPDGTTTTVVGHSYGTTVIGQSAGEHGLATDQIVAVASPGMNVDHAGELGIDPDDFYTTTAPGDVINVAAETGTHGADPNDSGVNWDGEHVGVDWEGFGGNTFTSEDMDGNAIDIHSNYWDQGNIARENLALIFTGNGGQVE